MKSLAVKFIGSNDKGWPEGWPVHMRKVYVGDLLERDEVEMTQVEFDTLKKNLQPAVTRLVESENLSRYQNAAYREIDQITREAINSGFEYEGLVFSLSLSAQHSMLAILADLSKWRSSTSFPLLWSDKDDTAVKSFSKSKHLTAFIKKGLARVAEVKLNGTIAKDKVRNSKDKLKIESIESDLNRLYKILK